jgi:glycosyltransferase involved in cell wall biosynthesis
LVRRGWQVEVIASTATEHGGACPVVGAAAAKAQQPVRLEHEGIRCTLFPVPPERGREWASLAAPAMDVELVSTLERFAPRVLLTFGGSDREAIWRARARAAGAAVVFAVHNEAYLHPQSPAAARDAVREGGLLLAPSEYLAGRYRAGTGVDVAVLPPPLDWRSVRATESDPVFTTFVNPEPAKGLMFIVRLFDELARQRPDIPLRVVESRGRLDHLLAAARRGGIDLSRHGNLFISPVLPSPAEVLAHSRILLMPSVWHEPAGRLACEAMVNGVVPLVSTRGGLPEMVAGAMPPLPLPAGLTMQTREPVPAAQVRNWQKTIEEFYDDEAAWQAASKRCRAVALARHGEDTLAARYDTLFRSVAARPGA